jgi:F-type H+-transporting ATPase subunit b
MTTIVLLVMLAEGDPAWWDYPGFELWKFVNLGLFILAALAIHRFLGRPIANGLQARRESIGRALVQARQERDDALRRLAEVESRLEGLDAEIDSIRQRAKSEAEAESERIKSTTEAELLKLRETAKREIDAATKAAASELKRFASDESIRLARQFIASDITAEDDARLTRERAERLGGAAN